MHYNEHSFIQIAITAASPRLMSGEDSTQHLWLYGLDHSGRVYYYNPELHGWEPISMMEAADHKESK